MTHSGLFWSYARRDLSTVGMRTDALRETLYRELCAFITDRSFEIWFDQRDLPAGSDWQTVLHRDLLRSDGLIVVLTNNWLASPHCRAELLNYHNHRTNPLSPIIPIRLTETNADLLSDPEILEADSLLREKQTTDWSSHRYELQDHPPDHHLPVPSAILDSMREKLVPNIVEAITFTDQSQTIPEHAELGAGFRRRVCNAVEYEAVGKAPISLDIHAGDNCVSNNEVLVLISAKFRSIRTSLLDMVFDLRPRSFEIWSQLAGGPMKSRIDDERVKSLGGGRWQVDASPSTELEIVELLTMEANEDSTTVELFTIAGCYDFEFTQVHGPSLNETETRLASIWLSKVALKQVSGNLNDSDSCYAIGNAKFTTRIVENDDGQA